MASSVLQTEIEECRGETRANLCKVSSSQHIAKPLRALCLCRVSAAVLRAYTSSFLLLPIIPLEVPAQPQVQVPLSPEAQTLLTELQTVVSGKPAPKAACRAGHWPKLAASTLPITTSSTALGGTPALFTASAEGRTAGEGRRRQEKAGDGKRKAGTTMRFECCDSSSPAP